ncbi:MAG: NUDIX domain-containing protein [Rectinemataceae bacterium]|nr:NUDIX domain-containing protein [Rectinemataceae bacterium]
MSRIPIVDENDVEISFKERSEVELGDIYRVSALWLTNSKGEVLLAQRSLHKKNGPGKWGPAVAGTVDEGETYEINILKESEEEIGLVLSPQEIRLGPKVKIQGSHLHFCQWYYAKSDKSIDEFVLQEDEVMDARWVSTEELIRLTDENPEMFSGSMMQWLPTVLQEA